MLTRYSFFRRQNQHKFRFQWRDRTTGNEGSEGGGIGAVAAFVGGGRHELYSIINVRGSSARTLLGNDTLKGGSREKVKDDLRRTDMITTNFLTVSVRFVCVLKPCERSIQTIT